MITTKRLQDFDVSPGNLVRICDCFNSKQIMNCVVLGEREYRDHGIYMLRYLYKGRAYEIALDDYVIIEHESNQF